jgi:hypothetical protein
MKARPPPVPMTISPKRMKIEITVADSPGNIPHSPLSAMKRRAAMRSGEKPACP